MATGIMIGLAVASAATQLKNSRNQAKSVAQQQANVAERDKQLTLARAGKQKASFLSSGLTLKGTPLAVLSSTFDVGKADIEQGISGANTQARNIIGAGRAQALSTLAGAAGSAAGGFGGSPTAPPAQTNPFQGITTTGTAPARGNIFGGTG